MVRRGGPIVSNTNERGDMVSSRQKKGGDRPVVSNTDELEPEEYRGKRNIINKQRVTNKQEVNIDQVDEKKGQ